MNEQLVTQILSDVRRERVRQDQKWGEQNHLSGTGEFWAYFADLSKKECDQAFAAGQGTWRQILQEEFFEALSESDPAKLKEELIQVMVVCCAWIECIERNERA